MPFVGKRVGSHEDPGSCGVSPPEQCLGFELKERVRGVTGIELGIATLKASTLYAAPSLQPLCFSFWRQEMGIKETRSQVPSSRIGSKSDHKGSGPHIPGNLSAEQGCRVMGFVA